MSADFDQDWARQVLTGVLGQPGGGETVITQLGSLPGAVFVPAEPKKLFRAARPSQLLLGDQGFSAPGQVGTQMQVGHVVRGVTLQTRTLGPGDTAESLVAGLRQLLDLGGPELPELIAAALYGLEAAGGISPA